MHRKAVGWLTSTLFITLLSPALVFAQEESGAVVTRPTLHVLGVGIDDYGQDFQLAGAVNDVRAVTEVLAQQPGYTPAVTLLTDAGATLDGIREEMSRIQASSGPGDVFVFHFSGFGEPGGEALLLGPGGEGALAFQRLTARMLREWTGSLPVRQALFILDAVDGSRFMADFIAADASARGHEGVSHSIAALTATGYTSEVRDPVTGEMHGILTSAVLRFLRETAGQTTQVSDLKVVPEWVAAMVQEGSLRGGAELFRRGPDFRLGGPLDEEGPTLSFQSELAVVLQGQVRDPAGVAQLYVGEQRVPVSPEGSYAIPLNTSTASSDSIRLRAVDRVGNETVSWVKLTRFRSEEVGASRAPERSYERTGRDYGLVIATNTYDHWSQLVNPAFDGQAVAEELEQAYGFEVEVLLDPTRNEVRQRITELARSSEFSDEDQLFIFIAGHGTYTEEAMDGFLAFRDTRRTVDDPYGDSGLRYSWLRDTLGEARAKHIMLVIDACFGGSFSGRLGTDGRRGDVDPMYGQVAPDQLVKRRMQYTTRRYITSGGFEYVDDGRPGQHSPFARWFLEALRSEGGVDGNGVLTFAEVSAFIDQVASSEPRGGSFVGDEPGSDFFFIRQ